MLLDTSQVLRLDLQPNYKNQPAPPTKLLDREALRGAVCPQSLSPPCEVCQVMWPVTRGLDGFSHCFTLSQGLCASDTEATHCA